MSMRKRGNGDGGLFYDEARKRWIGLLDVGVGASGQRRRRKVSGRTRAEARDKLRALQANQAAGLPVGDGRATVGGYLEHWLTTVVPATVKSSNTVDNYTWAVRKHLVPALGRLRLAALTPEDVEEMMATKAAAGLSRNSLMRIRSVLGQALRHAEKRGRVPRNAAALVETPDGPKKDGRALTAEQRARCSRQPRATAWRPSTSRA